MEPSLLFNTLQSLLKQRRLTYRDLAEHLKMSESGVKKLFASRDCALSKLSDICDFLSVSMDELFAAAARPPIPEVTLTEAQQVFLLNNPGCFAFYWLLTIERLSVKQIQSRYGLQPVRARRFIHQLDDLDLIMLLQPGDRIRLPASPLIRWTDQGPLVAHLNRVWSKTLCEDAAPPLAPNGPSPSASRERTPHMFRLHALNLPPDLAQALIQTLESTCDDFVRRSRLTPSAAHPSRLLIALSGGAFIQSIPNE